MRSGSILLFAVLAFYQFAVVHSPGQEPELPPGRAPEPEPQQRPAEGQAEPGLPPGLGGPENGEEEPGLPPGLGETEAEPSQAVAEEPVWQMPFDLVGFWEGRVGHRTQEDPHEKEISLGETRLQLEAERRWRKAGVKVTSDFLYDPVLDEHGVDLETGRGWVDLREAHLSFTPLAFMDLKVGRQILTWGTGDLVFLNDNFPKDWNSFFIGRDVEYLKAPSDAAKVSLFSDWANLNLVYTPRFDADRFIDGRRISYYNDNLGRRAGQDAVIHPARPNDWFEDEEVAARLYRTIGGYEAALYSYHGLWKSPAGQTPSGTATYPPLAVYGTSVRGKVGKGIGNVEIGYYDSRDDRSGTDPLVRNSEWRFLAGYEQDLGWLASDFTVGAQYYVEWMADHSAYERNLPPGVPPRDEVRHVLTLRLTKLLMQQNLELSWFMFYSPSDADAYLRPRASYKFTDNWLGELGGNFFIGRDDHTFFGQFEKNNNVYAAVRYSF